jgi:hypothetical protein
MPSNMRLEEEWACVCWNVYRGRGTWSRASGVKFCKRDQATLSRVRLKKGERWGGGGGVKGS